VLILTVERRGYSDRVPHEQDGSHKSLGRRYQMRLNQFTDPKPYTLSADDAADFLRQLETLWPNDDLAFVLAVKKLAPNKQRKPDLL